MEEKKEITYIVNEIIETLYQVKTNKKYKNNKIDIMKLYNNEINILNILFPQV